VIEVSEVSQVQEEVKEINLHIKARKISQEDVIQYLAEIDVDGTKDEFVVSPFKETNLYSAFSLLTGALHEVYRIATSKHENIKREEFNRALKDLEEAIADLLAYTISEDLE
jgi:phosphoenolpyruvate synthase/pyruvate phosphate dikinase